MFLVLKNRLYLEDDNIFEVVPENLFDYTAFWQIIGHNEFKNKISKFYDEDYQELYGK